MSGSELPVTTLVAMAGFLAGIIFGATANRTNFCTMGAISDVVFIGDYRRMRAWMLSIAVAIVGTQGLHSAGIIDIYTSIYLRPDLSWLGNIIGGLLFGFGMTLSGGCGNKTLVRIGTGNLKSIVVFLIMGLVAYMTLRGITSFLRINLSQMTNINLLEMGFSTQGISDMTATGMSIEQDTARWPVVALIAGGLAIYCFKDKSFRGSQVHVWSGIIVGAIVVSGWWITGVLGFDDFDPAPLTSFTFVAPSGESIQYLMIFTGTTINFGIAAVGGVIAGSFLMAIFTKTFNIETFADANDLLRNMSGAVLMGFGGVMAMGCTIGQGITGMSTLAVGSLISLIAIIGGGVFGMKYLEEGNFIDAFKTIFSIGSDE